MSGEEKFLLSVPDTWVMLGGKPKIRRDKNNKEVITNRSSAYALAKRIPDDCKVATGKNRFSVIWPRLRKYIEEGLNLAA